MNLKKKKGALFYAPIRTKEDLIKRLDEGMTLEEIVLNLEVDKVEEDEYDIFIVQMLKELQRLSKQDKGKYIT